MRIAPAVIVGASILTLGLGFTASARAAEQADPLAQIEPLIDPKILFQGVVREEDLALLFAHLKSALLASYQGREVPAPDELNRRLEAISGELRARGAVAGLLMLAAFEAAARQALREALAVPAPTAP